jgi:hypothetical protein
MSAYWLRTCCDVRWRPNSDIGQLKLIQLCGSDLVKIGGGELELCEEDEGGLGENDNVNHALMPDARFCV